MYLTEEVENVVNIYKFIKNIIFPPRCVFCDRIMEPNSRVMICGSCAGKPKLCSGRPCCEKCGKPLVSFGEKQLCYFCLNTRTKYFDRIVSVFEYEGAVQRSVVRYKTMHIVKYAGVYAEFMAARFFEEYSDIDFDFMCSVPPHDKRRRNDEPDQVEAICRKLSGVIGLKYIPDVLVKTRKTDKQSYLNYRDRQNNMKNSIKAADSSVCAGKTVLLTDDVCTTRATVTECARALKAAGAKRVYALTLATTMKEECAEEYTENAAAIR